MRIPSKEFSSLFDVREFIEINEIEPSEEPKESIQFQIL